MADFIGQGELISGRVTEGGAVETELGLIGGADFLYRLSLPSGAQILCLTHSHNRYEVGERIHVRPRVDQVVAFPLETPGSS